ncbi:hypothetical protein HYU14_02620 [Candidatus Woesearchaeota archaeon]|nr:hypothetical protein [Candidatus Woesearchaeota archaeon]
MLVRIPVVSEAKNAADTAGRLRRKANRTTILFPILPPIRKTYLMVALLRPYRQFKKPFNSYEKFVSQDSVNYLNFERFNPEDLKMQETITILKEEYDRLKKLEMVEWDLVHSFKNSLDDLKSGRVKRVR